jgi:hypothetical protein
MAFRERPKDAQASRNGPTDDAEPAAVPSEPGRALLADPNFRARERSGRLSLQ